jgi:hypothetical protein
VSDADSIRSRLEAQKQIIAELESELLGAERGDRPERWFPHGFYLAYYILTGMVLGMVAAWIVLGLNVLGGMLVGLDDPLRLLRVYSTILGGSKTAESRDAVVLAFATGLHTCTGIICGTPIHVVYSRWLPGQKVPMRILSGVVLGLAMWIVNHYLVLSWLQPLMTGESPSYIVENIPVAIAAFSHIAFAEIIVLAQPLALFDPERYAKRIGPA